MELHVFLGICFWQKLALKKNLNDHITHNDCITAVQFSKAIGPTAHDIQWATHCYCFLGPIFFYSRMSNTHHWRKRSRPDGQSGSAIPLSLLTLFHVFSSPVCSLSLTFSFGSTIWSSLTQIQNRFAFKSGHKPWVPLLIKICWLQIREHEESEVNHI